MHGQTEPRDGFEEEAAGLGGGEEEEGKRCGTQGASGGDGMGGLAIEGGKQEAPVEELMRNDGAEETTLDFPLKSSILDSPLGSLTPDSPLQCTPIKTPLLRYYTQFPAAGEPDTPIEAGYAEQQAEARARGILGRVMVRLRPGKRA